VIDAHVTARPRGAARARVAAILVLAVAAGIGLGALVHGLLAPGAARRGAGSTVGLRGQATWAPGAQPAPAIASLRDQSGHGFSLSALRGRTVAMTFLDSRCHQACPLEGRALAASLRALPVAERPALVVVSVNPRDTPASERAAVRHWGLPAGVWWYWLAGDRERLAPVWRAYHVFVAAGRGDIVHTEAVYLIDRRGDERSGYLFPFLPASLRHDLGLIGGKAAGRV
jgi:protein SCO1